MSDLRAWLHDWWWCMTWPNDQWMRRRMRDRRRRDRELKRSIKRDLREPRQGNVRQLDDYRTFDIGTPLRCWKCGARDGVARLGGEGGFVWGCVDCGHPAD